MVKEVSIILCFLKLIKCEMEPFVVGGNLTRIENHPHSAFLSVNCVIRNGEKIVWMCGASIVNQKVLLTAAHCLESCLQASVITINVGNANNTKGFATTAHSFVFHENYMSSGEEFDIGLVKSRTPLTLNTKISRVAIFKNPPHQDVAQLAGWGLINESLGLMSPLLKSINQKIWSRKDCTKIIGPLPNGTFCAGSRRSDDYAAPGDSGSALLINGYIQIGLVSYKVPSISRSLIVYTDVAYYFDWIKTHIETLYCRIK